MIVKPGTRLRSVACTTEVVVVKAGGEDRVLTCGGHALAADEGAARDAALAADAAGGTILGKRYTDEGATIELLCTSAGAGTLALDGVPLQIKAAKPLPSSD